ncbi:MAG: hypothetical protein M3Y54_20925 [Bacteroidota bacterium]|nr:hypothetical protein [Bacteroidota bacterium]
MNLTSTLVNQRPPRARATGPAPAAVAILYPKVGTVLRVPLRRTSAGGPRGCEQHPERQFMVWFNRMTAARPGFPMQIRSILLISGRPLCASCHRALATYLSRYHLADKLRLRTTGPAAGCGCRGRCGCTTQPGADAGSRHMLSALLLDQLLADSELEEEGWWRKVRNLGQAAVLAGATLFPPAFPIKPVVDMISAAAAAEKKRRDIQQTVDDNTPSSRRPGQVRELENPFLANAFSREFELDKEKKQALKQLVAGVTEQLRQPLYETKTKPGRSGDPVKAQVNRNTGAELIRRANNISAHPQLRAAAAAQGINPNELASALKAHGNWLIGKASQSRHKELELF